MPESYEEVQICIGKGTPYSKTKACIDAFMKEAEAQGIEVFGAFLQG